MVERSLSMREVPGSIPGASKIFTVSSFEIKSQTTYNVEIKTIFLTLSILKQKACNVRESNPGRPRGRRAFYH